MGRGLGRMVHGADATVPDVIEIRSAHPVERADLDAIRTLHDTAALADGHEALGSSVWRDLETGGRPGSVGGFAFEGAQLVGYAHVTPSDNFSPPHWAAGIVVAPTRRGDSVATALLDGIVEHVRRTEPGEIVLWILGPTDADDQHAAAAGFEPSRDLLQMRVALPLDVVAREPDGITVRRFLPGTDEAAWLAVNNRAFRNHPEQGGWIASTLAHRMAEPWFDPDGFLLAWSTDPAGLAGFCWTKIHQPGSDDAGLGEIFVVGVDPTHQGTGLGRKLTVAGLGSLAARGVRVGMLYVDGANTAAVGLYRALGFTVHRRDRAYQREVR